MKADKLMIWFIGIGLGMVVAGSVLLVIGIELIKEQNLVESIAQDYAKNEYVQQDVLDDKSDLVSNSMWLEEESELDLSSNTQEESIEQDITEANIEEQINIDTEPTEGASQPASVVQNLSTSILAEDNNINYIEIFIPTNSPSQEICDILYQHGITNDLEALQQYIEEQGKSKVLQKGYFWFPENASNEDILTILLNSEL